MKVVEIVHKQWCYREDGTPYGILPSGYVAELVDIDSNERGCSVFILIGSQTVHLADPQPDDIIIEETA